MSTDLSSLPPCDTTSAAVITIADVIARVTALPGLSAKQRADLVSAPRTVCRALNTEPECLVANLRDLRVKLAKISPASIGVSQSTWANVRSRTIAALNHAGIRALPGRYREPLPPEWEALRERLSEDVTKHRVSRFMSFCAANGIKPLEVTEETFIRFQSEIENNSLIKRPTAVYRETCLTWNEAADTIPGWPQVRIEVPNRRRDFAFPEGAFPKRFRLNVDAYVTNRSNPDVFAEDYCRPLSKITLEQRRKQIFLLATALVLSGFPIRKITTLRVLVQPANAEAALRFLFERAGGKPTPFVARAADLLATIGKHHVRLKEPQLERLRGLARNLRPDPAGFSEKNRAFLRQFADHRKLPALLRLPDDLVRQVKRRCLTGRRAAVQVENALAIAIELVLPLRMDDLAGLCFDKHIHYHGNTVLISVTAEKNGCTVDAELPPKVAQLLDLYRRVYRPRLAGPDSLWLFPGEKGERRQTGGFGSQLSRFVYSQTGITMTPHQFRHLSAWIYLSEHPTDHETVRRLLGHRSLATTIRFYQELDKLMASKRYNEIVSRLVAEQGFAASPIPRRKARRP